ncbi:MAG TPA: ectonucleotide pyrophosphatase/phosphodiesterase [Blastocatellia bacterium]|nr:ectonucleotide pyrophosphatase/phosphodiesterase [Blastocatellia bacterium]
MRNQQAKSVVTRFNRYITLIVLAFLPVWTLGSRPLPQQVTLKPTVLLISLDGFRADYLDRGVSPNLKSLIDHGVRAKSMIPAFPSETFPNHYTIVTGNYPETNGIVKNSFYDPVSKEVFQMGTQPANQSKWWGAEPIWITAEKQGQIAATYFWPGSEAVIEGKRATYWKVYDGHVPNSDRVKEVLSWFAMPEDKRPTFISLYFSDVDHAGHNSGPDSPEVNESIKQVDTAIGQLIKGLNDQKIFGQVNIIVVSDHGMAAVSRERRVFLEDYISLSDLEPGHNFVGTNAHLWPLPGKEDKVLEALSKAPHLKAYKKENTPDYFHYRNNPRIAPIVCVADEGWSILLNRRPEGDRPSREGTGGSHGYDPKLPSMQAIFIAEGPAFKQGLVVPSFENIQVYNIMASILHLKPAPNNGNLSTVQTMLKQEQIKASR